MKIIQISDIHLGKPGELVWGLDPIERFAACLNDARTHHADASFVVITGDLAERGEVAAYEALNALLEDFPLPAHLMIGNHDNRDNFQRVFSETPRDSHGFVQFRVSADNKQFLFLDTFASPETSAGAYCEARCGWLRRELFTALNSDLYVFMYHPPFDIEHPLMDAIKLMEPDGFSAAIEGFPVRHLFFGHAHRPISGQSRGIGFSTIPGTCHQLPLVGESLPTVFSDEPAMYAVAHLFSDRTVVHADACLDRKPAVMGTEGGAR